MASNQYPTVPFDVSKHPAIAIVEQIYKKYFEKNIEGILVYLTDDVQWNCNAAKEKCPIAGRYTGHDGVREYFKKDFEEISNSMTIQNYKHTENGTCVYVNGVCTYTVKATGKTFDGSWEHLFELENGKIKKLDMMIHIECIN